MGMYVPNILGAFAKYGKKRLLTPLFLSGPIRGEQLDSTGRIFLQFGI